jgi:hypothetical protein
MSPLLGAAITAGQNQPAPAPKINPEIARQKQMNLMQKIAMKLKLLKIKKKMIVKLKRMKILKLLSFLNAKNVARN